MQRSEESYPWGGRPGLPNPDADTAAQVALEAGSCNSYDEPEPEADRPAPNAGAEAPHAPYPPMALPYHTALQNYAEEEVFEYCGLCCVASRPEPLPCGGNRVYWYDHTNRTIGCTKVSSKPRPPGMVLEEGQGPPDDDDGLLVQTTVLYDRVPRRVREIVVAEGEAFIATLNEAGEIHVFDPRTRYMYLCQQYLNQPRGLSLVPGSNDVLFIEDGRLDRADAVVPDPDLGHASRATLDSYPTVSSTADNRENWGTLVKVIFGDLAQSALREHSDDRVVASTTFSGSLSALNKGIPDADFDPAVTAQEPESWPRCRGLPDLHDRFRRSIKIVLFIPSRARVCVEDGNNQAVDGRSMARVGEATSVAYVPHAKTPSLLVGFARFSPDRDAQGMRSRTGSRSTDDLGVRPLLASTSPIPKLALQIPGEEGITRPGQEPAAKPPRPRPSTASAATRKKRSRKKAPEPFKRREAPKELEAASFYNDCGGVVCLPLRPSNALGRGKARRRLLDTAAGGGNRDTVRPLSSQLRAARVQAANAVFEKGENVLESRVQQKRRREKAAQETARVGAFLLKKHERYQRLLKRVARWRPLSEPLPQRFAPRECKAMAKDYHVEQVVVRSHPEIILSFLAKDDKFISAYEEIRAEGTLLKVAIDKVVEEQPAPRFPFNRPDDQSLQSKAMQQDEIAEVKDFKDEFVKTPRDKVFKAETAESRRLRTYERMIIHGETEVGAEDKEAQMEAYDRQNKALSPTGISQSIPLNVQMDMDASVMPADTEDEVAVYDAAASQGGSLDDDGSSSRGTGRSLNRLHMEGRPMFRMRPLRGLFGVWHEAKVILRDPRMPMPHKLILSALPTISEGDDEEMVLLQLLIASNGVINPTAAGPNGAALPSPRYHGLFVMRDMLDEGYDDERYLHPFSSHFVEKDMQLQPMVSGPVRSLCADARGTILLLTTPSLEARMKFAPQPQANQPMALASLRVSNESYSLRGLWRRESSFALGLRTAKGLRAARSHPYFEDGSVGGSLSVTQEDDVHVGLLMTTLNSPKSQGQGPEEVEQPKDLFRVPDPGEGEAGGVNVAVVLRCRPLLPHEIARGERSVVTCRGREAVVPGDVLPLGRDRTFDFDRVFGQDATQEDLYADAVFPCVDRLLAGYNATVCAYGQTGSGKTFTMEGEGWGHSVGNLGAQAGMIPRAVVDIFTRLEKEKAEGDEAMQEAYALARKVAESNKKQRMRAMNKSLGNASAAPSMTTANTGNTPSRRRRKAVKWPRRLASWNVSVSHVEIYCEQLYDLLARATNDDGEPPPVPKMGLTRSKSALDLAPKPIKRVRPKSAVGTRPRAKTDGEFARGRAMTADEGGGDAPKKKASPLSASGWRRKNDGRAFGAGRQHFSGWDDDDDDAGGDAGEAAAGAPEKRGIAKQLKVEETAKGGVVVRGLESVRVTAPQDIIEILSRTSQNRRTAETLCNRQSSRSHSIFTIDVQTVYEYGPPGATGEIVKEAHLHLVDLSGSENIKRSGAEGLRVMEAKNIGLGLLALGRCIGALFARNEHIPFRDSRLTRILADSLGGDSFTVMVLNATPVVSMVDETVATLTYASMVRGIKTKPKRHRTKTTASAMRKAGKSPKKGDAPGEFGAGEDGDGGLDGEGGEDDDEEESDDDDETFGFDEMLGVKNTAEEFAPAFVHPWRGRVPVRGQLAAKPPSAKLELNLARVRSKTFEQTAMFEGHYLQVAFDATTYDWVRSIVLEDGAPDAIYPNGLRPKFLEVLKDIHAVVDRDRDGYLSAGDLTYLAAYVDAFIESVSILLKKQSKGKLGATARRGALATTGRSTGRSTSLSGAASSAKRRGGGAAPKRSTEWHPAEHALTAFAQAIDGAVLDSKARGVRRGWRLGFDAWVKWIASVAAAHPTFLRTLVISLGLTPNLNPNPDFNGYGLIYKWMEPLIEAPEGSRPRHAGPEAAASAPRDSMVFALAMRRLTLLHRGAVPPSEVEILRASMHGKADVEIPQAYLALVRAYSPAVFGSVVDFL
uniref:Uncharacterized protein n=1 Tax=Phaeomonas parva TaxID=124430 RepID=A0A7S1U4N2_9STRA|mmetsp:Transcript_29041/g.92932  ORF Transcript_29041/g.92932 Transcript_29041/m.92932 type:complete len:2013 (+) Transcript_29041:315-6353(+)